MGKSWGSGGTALLSWLDRMPVTAVWRSLGSCLKGLEWASGPKTGLKFNSRADRKGALFHGRGGLRIGMPDLPNKLNRTPLLNLNYKLLIFRKYVPCNIWDMLKSYLCFIRNSFDGVCPAFYLIHFPGESSLMGAFSSLLLSGITISPCSLTCWDMLLKL